MLSLSNDDILSHLTSLVDTLPPSPCEKTGEYMKSHTSATGTQKGGGRGLASMTA
jgi:hypothetical protein